MESGGSMWLGNYMGEVFLAHFIVVVINFTETCFLAPVWLKNNSFLKKSRRSTGAALQWQLEGH